MCNVIQYIFACQHRVRIRRSYCSGTKHKVTRTSVKAACNANPCLSITKQMDCGTCQHEKWNKAWTGKVDRARTFLRTLRDGSLPGIHEITQLVEELENEYTRASWKECNTFAEVHRPSVTRVETSIYHTALSPLSQELHSNDIAEPITPKLWADMDESDYDGDYEASTDPLHPVTTNYTFPFGDEDADWALQHHSIGDQEPAIPDTEIDFNSNLWTWNDIDTGNPTPSVDIEIQTEQQDRNQASATDIVAAFWAAVNTPSTTSSTVTQPPTTPPLTLQLHEQLRFSSRQAAHDQVRKELSEKTAEEQNKFYRDRLISSRLKAQWLQGVEGPDVPDPLALEVKARGGG